MSLRDDVRWVCDAADGLLIGWLPPRLPKWTTKEGEKLGWLVLLLWRKFYEAAMARTTLEAEIQRLQGDVDGLRATNERLTDMLDDRQREGVLASLASEERRAGYYWVRCEGHTAAEVAYWNGNVWCARGSTWEPESIRVLSNQLRLPEAPP